MKKVLLIVFSMVLTLSVLTACGGTKSADTVKSNSSTSKSSAAKSNESATAIIALKGPVLTLDPANHRDRVTEAALRNIYDGLVTSDEKGNTVPQIAKSWKQTSPTEYVFNLRNDVKFQDGSKLTAKDVKFTFDRLIKKGGMEGKTSPRKGLLGTLADVQVVDDYTVKFILDKPWPLLMKMLPHQQIIPEAYFKKVGIDGFLKKPIGAGPYKVVSAKLDEQIVLESFNDYYKGAPKIKNLVLQVIPEISSRVAALKSGEVQRIRALTPDLVPELKKDSNIEVKMVDSTRVHMLELNTQKKPFSDVRVRQAMNYGINMDLIVEKVLNGYAHRLAGPMLADAFGINKDLKPYAYDPEKAKKLLADAGYSNGFKLVIDTTATNKLVADAIAGQLRNIGIQATTRVWDSGVIKPLLIKGERQAFLGDWGNSSMDPYGFLNPKLITKARGNYSLYSNPKVDDLLDKASTEIDVAKRIKMYQDAQQIIYDEAPWVFGYAMKEIEAGSKKLQGWNPAPDGMLYMLHATMEK